MKYISHKIKTVKIPRKLFKDHKTETERKRGNNNHTHFFNIPLSNFRFNKIKNANKSNKTNQINGREISKFIDSLDPK